MIQEGCCNGQNFCTLKVRHTADSAEKRCSKAMQQSNDIVVVQWCSLLCFCEHGNAAPSMAFHVVNGWCTCQHRCRQSRAYPYYPPI